VPGISGKQWTKGQHLGYLSKRWWPSNPEPIFTRLWSQGAKAWKEFCGLEWYDPMPACRMVPNRYLVLND
jgi:hypothetical protein